MERFFDMTDWGLKFLELAKYFIKKGLKLHPQIANYTDIEQTVKAETNADVWCFDETFYYLSKEEWEDLILNRSFVEKVEYKSEYRDCDNIASIFHSFMSEMFDVNGVATVLGAVYVDDELSGYHAWNAFYTDEGIYFLEPQTDVIFKPDEMMGNVRYEAELMMWF